MDAPLAARVQNIRDQITDIQNRMNGCRSEVSLYTFLSGTGVISDEKDTWEDLVKAKAFYIRGKTAQEQMAQSPHAKKIEAIMVLKMMGAPIQLEENDPCKPLLDSYLAIQAEIKEAGVQELVMALAQFSLMEKKDISPDLSAARVLVNALSDHDSAISKLAEELINAVNDKRGACIATFTCDILLKEDDPINLITALMSVKGYYATKEHCQIRDDLFYCLDPDSSIRDHLKETRGEVLSQFT
jgi:hypothetical protein